VIKALESRGGTDLLSAPEVTTLSGRQAQIKVVDINYIVTDLDIGETNATKRQPEILPTTEPFELGPVIDVIPYVQPDGYTIQMTVITSLKEFLGYEDPQTVQPAIAGAARANGVTSPVPLPKFRLRQVATSALVWDGQTLMIGAGSARTMQRDRDANGVITTNFTEKELIYFITPRLIDAAGNPLHSDDEFPERHKTVPAQRKPK
jgi:general secretion pathway protein D